MSLKVGDLGEFKLIDTIKKAAADSDRLIKGIGDDTAVIDNQQDNLLWTCDLLLEGRHFLRDKITPYQLGYKSLAVNASDIAAMGGEPSFALVSCGWPQDLDIEFVEQFFKGFNDLAAKFGIVLVGGDTVSSEQIIVDVTLMGRVDKDKTVFRNGAGVGDIVAVTGTPGESGAGLELLLKTNKDCCNGLPNSNSEQTEKKTLEHLANRHLIPEPRVQEGKILASMGASAMIDVSDGLSSELHHLSGESGVQLEIYREKLPISLRLEEAGDILQKELLDYVLYGGEDYELLVTIPENKWSALEKQYSSSLPGQLAQLTPIGRVTGKLKGTGDKVLDRGKVTIINDDGRTDLDAGGYNHFPGH